MLLQRNRAIDMDIGDLVKTLGTPFANSQKKLIKFSKFSYHIAFANKVPLTYSLSIYIRKCKKCIITIFFGLGLCWM